MMPIRFVYMEFHRADVDAARQFYLDSIGRALRERALPAEVVRNEWGVIVEHRDLIELRWLPSTSQMTDGGFMTTLCLFASVAETVRPHALFIDATEFTHSFGPGVMEWRDAHIIPRYGSAGVRKFAFLMPAGFAKAGTEALEGPAVFPTKWFVNRQEALDWLRAG